MDNIVRVSNESLHKIKFKLRKICQYAQITENLSPPEGLGGMENMWGIFTFALNYKKKRAERPLVGLAGKKLLNTHPNRLLFFHFFHACLGIAVCTSPIFFCALLRLAYAVVHRKKYPKCVRGACVCGVCVCGVCVCVQIVRAFLRVRAPCACAFSLVLLICNNLMHDAQGVDLFRCVLP